jgi:hypothetical protein
VRTLQFFSVVCSATFICFSVHGRGSVDHANETTVGTLTSKHSIIGHMLREVLWSWICCRSINLFLHGRCSENRGTVQMTVVKVTCLPFSLGYSSHIFRDFL